MRSVIFTTIFLGAALMSSAHDGLAQTSVGKTAYLKNCRSCHGTTGTPPKQALREHPKIRALNAEFMGPIPLDSIVTVITNGFGKGDEMKPFKSKLTKEEIQAVAEYVKNELAKPR